jgi:hypothetical protein
VIAAAVILAQAMGGPMPGSDVGRATAACSHRLAQLATRYGIVDLAAQAISPVQHVNGDRLLVRLTVIIRYNRKGGVELRKGVIGCLVNPTGRVEFLEALPR